MVIGSADYTVSITVPVCESFFSGITAAVSIFLQSTSKGPPTRATSVSKPASRPVSQLAHSLHEAFSADAKVPGPQPIDPSKPYQVNIICCEINNIFTVNNEYRYLDQD